MAVEMQIQDLSKHFGGLKAVSEVSFELEQGELLGLIGTNGAGKTTVFNLITGLLRPSGGRVLFRGEDLVGLPPHRISESGIARTFQNIRLMSGLTVRENLKPAFHNKISYSFLGSILRTSSFIAEEAAVVDKIDELLKLLDVTEYSGRYVQDLPYGTQRRVEIARALALEPEVLLLDEPTAGLNSREAHEIVDVIKYLSQELEMSIIVIEHNMRVIMSICSRIVVMDQGRVIAAGTPEEIQNDPEVIRVYLGEKVGA